MNGKSWIMSWVGPDPDRIDAASVRLEAGRLEAVGTSTTADGAVAYQLTTGADWVTRRLEVAVIGHDGRRRGLDLSREPDRGWSATRDGKPLTLPELRGALDCDLDLCPVTNTMPILRTGLVAAARGGDSRAHTFTMAWVSLPELEVTLSVQEYRALHPVDGGGAVIGFRSGDWESTIEVDRDGLVVNYPSIGRRLLTFGA